MTTNKPEVKKYTPESGYDSVMRKTNWMREEECGLYVSLSDYEALQLDRDQQYQMKVKAREQRDAVTAELESLQAECEKLRKDAEAERQLQRAAQCLPEGWRIVVEVEKDSGLVDVYDPDYRRIEIGGGGSLAEQIEQAIDAAIQETNP